MQSLYCEILNKIIGFHGITIELCGSWIWAFDSYNYRKELKEMGFKYASKKKLWYWHNQEEKIKNKKSKSMEEIREKYGSQKIFTEKSQKVLVG